MAGSPQQPPNDAQGPSRPVPISPNPLPTSPNPGLASSSLSHQLADLRQVYQRNGQALAVPNIPSYSGSLASRHLEHPTETSTPSRSSPLAGPSLSIARRESSVDDLTDEQKAAIVRRHLMTKEEQLAAARQLLPSTARGVDEPNQFDLRLNEADDLDSNVECDTERPATTDLGPELYPTPYHLQGGDIHHDVYKWANKFSAGGPPPLQPTHPRHTGLPFTRTRSMSVSATSAMISESGHAPTSNDHSSDTGLPSLAYRDIMQPGGFRRAFLYQKRNAIGQPYSVEDGKRFTKSFIDFLSLYGHFGGEDLEEIDEQEEADYRALQDLHDMEQDVSDDDAFAYRQSERTALLRSASRKAVRPPSAARSATKLPGFSAGSSGDATATQAVLMLLKSLVGTGVLFLAKAFANGGMIFSVLTLVFISMISTYSFVLLVKTRLEIPGGFGEIGGILYGPWLRWAILSSLVISQLGFVTAYTIFIAENLQAFVLAITDCKHLIPIYVLIFGQLIAYLPLAMIRNIQKLSGTALIADVFILIGLLYVFGYESNVISTIGMAPIQAFNPKSFPLLIGTAVFAFEGIGLVIPITESMKQPEKFPAVLTGVMVALTFLFAGAGALGYAAFGNKVQTVVLVNLPQEDKMVNAVQFLYSIAIMLSTPLQLFPAVRIMENGWFSTSGKYSNKVKWQKNLFRTVTVIFCAFIAWAGARDLDKFVSLIGSVACVPLCFCYPAMLHYRARAKSLGQKLADIALFIFGIVAAVYTTAQTLSIMSVEQPEDSTPKFGHCQAEP